MELDTESVEEVATSTAKKAAQAAPKGPAAVEQTVRAELKEVLPHPRPNRRP